MAILCAFGAIGAFGLATRDSFKSGVLYSEHRIYGNERTVHVTHLDRIGYTTIGIFCLVGFSCFVRKAREGDIAPPAPLQEPLSPQPLPTLDDVLQNGNYHRLPGSLQWGPDERLPVNKAKWKPCANCGRSIPVIADFVTTTDGRREKGGTCTYVCPFCSHCHVGAVPSPAEFQKQKTCHECGASLGQSYQCPQCLFPRGWMRVVCRHCKNRQPVLAPHWVDMCDTFYLECVRCESVSISLCIC